MLRGFAQSDPCPAFVHSIPPVARQWLQGPFFAETLVYLF